jgi:hypothetical protein
MLLKTIFTDNRKAIRASKTIKVRERIWTAFPYIKHPRLFFAKAAFRVQKIGKIAFELVCFFMVAPVFPSKFHNGSFLPPMVYHGLPVGFRLFGVHSLARDDQTGGPARHFIK